MLVKFCVATIRVCIFRCVPLLERTFLFLGVKMEIYRVTFAGHRVIDASFDIQNKIELLVRDLLRQKEYVEFYVGRNGDLDIWAASAVKRAQKAVGSHNSSLILVQPYGMKDDAYYECFYDEVIYPIGTKTHPKTAITKRNCWMVDQADLLVAYVESDRTGGALNTLKYAEKKGKAILNFAKKIP